MGITWPQVRLHDGYSLQNSCDPVGGRDPARIVGRAFVQINGAILCRAFGMNG